MEEILDHLLPNQNLDEADQAGSQYQSAEQLGENEQQQSISRQISAIMDQQRSLLEEEEEDEEVNIRSTYPRLKYCGAGAPKY